MILKQETKRCLSPQQVEQLYSIPIGTLANMRWQKRGPKFFLLENASGKRRKVLYFIEDVEKWIRINQMQTVDSANNFN